ncbi:MAG: hypothetical protein ACP5OR_00930 [Candidatus Dormibacteria bacterium]
MNRSFAILLALGICITTSCGTTAIGNSTHRVQSSVGGQQLSPAQMGDVNRIAVGYAKLLTGSYTFTGKWNRQSAVNPFTMAQEVVGHYNFATNAGIASSQPKAFSLVEQLGSAYVGYVGSGTSSQVWKGLVLQSAPPVAKPLSSFADDLLLLNPAITEEIVDNGIVKVEDTGPTTIAGRSAESYRVTTDLQSVLQQSNSEESLLVDQVVVTAMSHSSKLAANVYLGSSGDIVQWSIDVPGSDLGTITFSVTGSYAGSTAVIEPSNVQYIQGYAPPNSTDIKQHDGDAS